MPRSRFRTSCWAGDRPQAFLHEHTGGGCLMLAHSIVPSRLDYANALLHGMSDRNLDRLQVALQNSVARVVCQAPRSASATKLRQQLHWLPIRQRITYKISLITYKMRTTQITCPISSTTTYRQEHYGLPTNRY